MLDESAVRLNSIDNTMATVRKPGKYLIENKLVQEKAARKGSWRKKSAWKAIKIRRARVCTVHVGTVRL